jgi:hypothetical protein
MGFPSITGTGQVGRENPRSRSIYGKAVFLELSERRPFLCEASQYENLPPRRPVRSGLPQ